MQTDIVITEQRQVQLGLPGIWTPTSWEPPSHLDFAEWLSIGPSLSKMEEAVHWWIGDWLNYGERKWGEDYAQAMDITGFTYATVTTDAWVAKSVKVSRRRETLFWSHHREVASLKPKEQDRWLKRAEEQGWSMRRLRGEIRDWKARKRRQELIESGEHVATTILVGDFREIAAALPPDSIDLIFTDPPYDEASVPLYGDLAEIGARVLRPGGVCMAYSGHAFLPQVLNNMNLHLDYAWTCGIRHSGGNLRYRKYRIYNNWKPVVMFVKPPRDVWWNWFDDLTTGGKEKDAHQWQQALAEAKHYISALCPPGGVVFDPFLGSGTAALAAQALGLRFVGCDKDPEAVATAKERLNEDDG